MTPRKATPAIAKILRSEEIYKGPVFGVRRDDVLEPGGLCAICEVFTHPGAVGVAQAAARELIEETGYRAQRLRLFLDVFPTPGFLEERMYILLAEKLTAGEAQPEEDEKITAKAFTPTALERMIRQNTLRDAKTIAGLLYYFRFLAGKRKRN